jgi:hypothetical protein
MLCNLQKNAKKTKINNNYIGEKNDAEPHVALCIKTLCFGVL